MTGWLLLGLALEPATVWQHQPIEPTPEAVLYTQVSGEAVACTVEMDLSITGELKLVSPLSCPDALFKAVRDSLLQWRFNPAQEGERSVPTRQRFTAVFESETVWLERSEDARYAHVRVPPVAVPLWPQSPQKSESLRALFVDFALPGGSCVLEFGVNSRGAPDDLVIVDCPNEVALALEKSLRRWGMNVVGGSRGDAVRYRLEMPF